MLYIHIPFCKNKCIYCDFYSGGNPDWNKYLKAVETELSSRIGELEGERLSSIYFGGGTPSLMPLDRFGEFFNSIKNILRLHDVSLAKDIEVTLEVNPEDVTRESVKLWNENGVNRISMGIQSLIEDELKLLKRRHTALKAIESAELIKERFHNLSLDIIYGIPGQTAETLNSTLEGILALQPTHISAYSLTYETGTPLIVFRDKGIIKECSEEDSILFSNIIIDTLERRGYDRYEISNFALPGFESRHNSGYWTGKKYLGLGPSASSYDGGNIRRTNPHDLKGYINYFSENLQGKTEKFYMEEELTKEELMEERIFTSLRTAKGLNLKSYTSGFGEMEAERLKKAAHRWVNTGHLIMDEEGVRLTKKGFEISDYIILSLV